MALMQRCVCPAVVPTKLYGHHILLMRLQSAPGCSVFMAERVPRSPSQASTPWRAKPLSQLRGTKVRASWRKQPPSKQPPEDEPHAGEAATERPSSAPHNEPASTSTSTSEQPQQTWLGAFGNARQFWQKAAEQQQGQRGKRSDSQGLWHTLTALMTGSGGLLSGSSALQPWTALVLVPIIVWCITWSLTGGMAVLASSCMGGMSGIARLLHPTLPWKGVDYEDVAIMLTKAMNTGSDAMWSRNGLWVAPWLLRGAMQQMYTAATSSVVVASTLMRAPAWLWLMDVSRALLYVSCFFLMLPTGTWLRDAYQAVRGQPQGHRLSSTNALLLKLAGLLTWPCISTAAVSTYQQQQPALAPNFPTAAAQLLASSGSFLLLLGVAGSAAWMACLAARRRAGLQTVMHFGRGVGLACALQAVLNVLQLAVDAASGQIVPANSAAQVVSTLILARIAWGVQQLHQQQQAPPEAWLEQLSFAPGPNERSDSGSLPA